MPTICELSTNLIASSPLGVSFTLPQRQIAAESAYSYKLDSMEGGINVIGNVWFDKKRDEAQKLMILTEMEYKFTDDRSSLIMRTNSGLQFPTFPKVIIQYTFFLIV